MATTTTTATSTTTAATGSTILATNGDSKGKPLEIHKDNLTADALNLKDSHVAASLGLFMIHNNIRRNLLACSRNAIAVPALKQEQFRYYADYTLHVLEDQLESVDTIWFPAFAKYDSRFDDQITAHASIKEKIGQLRDLLKPTEEGFPAEQISRGFEGLHSQVNQEFDLEEQLSNDLGHVVPLAEIKKMEAQQESRRKADEKTWGLPWTFAFLMKGLSPKERAIFPPGVPRLVKDAMLADSTPLISTAEQRAREEVVREQMTVYKHDRQFLSALYKVPMRALLVIAFLHFYMKSTKSLLLQSILPLKHLWDAEVFQVHIRGRAGSGKLQRPWKQRKSARQLVTEYVDIARGLWKGRYSREKKTE
ncbi:hypothetical protein MMC08_006603 [Hypocenomyce scalaris]|nr:hypothetical protein [Hypocenomyce scalaris]